MKKILAIVFALACVVIPLAVYGSQVALILASKQYLFESFNIHQYSPVFTVHRLYDNSTFDVYIEPLADIDNSAAAFSDVGDGYDYTLYKYIDIGLIATECTQQMNLYLYHRIDESSPVGREELANGVGFCVTQTIQGIIKLIN